MSVAKISILIGAAIVTAGSTAAVATRDKWLPKEQKNTQSNPEDTDGVKAPNGVAVTKNPGLSTIPPNLP